jgi:Flp pilus assembly pilin Flp
MTPSTGTIGTARRSCACRPLRRLAESGQATAEYALVLLGVAFIAVLVLDWARNTNMIGRLLNAVFKSVTKLIT